MTTVEINQENTNRYIDWCYGDAPELDGYNYCTHSATHFTYHNDEALRREFSAMTATTREDDDARFNFILSKTH